MVAGRDHIVNHGRGGARRISVAVAVPLPAIQGTGSGRGRAGPLTPHLISMTERIPSTAERESCYTRSEIFLAVRLPNAGRSEGQWSCQRNNRQTGIYGRNVPRSDLLRCRQGQVMAASSALTCLRGPMVRAVMSVLNRTSATRWLASGSSPSTATRVGSLSARPVQDDADQGPTPPGRFYRRGR